MNDQHVSFLNIRDRLYTEIADVEHRVRTYQSLENLLRLVSRQCIL